MVWMRIVNVCDIKPSYMRILTAVIVAVFAVPGYVVIDTDLGFVTLDVINGTVSLNLTVTGFVAAAGVSVEGNDRIVTTKTMLFAKMIGIPATLLAVIVIIFCFSIT